MSQGALEAALPREMYVEGQAWLVERDAALFGQWYCIGRLVKAPHTDHEGPALDAFRLHPVGVEEWAGFVFVHLTPEHATPLADAVGRAGEALANYDLSGLGLPGPLAGVT